MNQLHHYLPATYLALFSRTPRIPRRNSFLAVGDKQDKRVFVTSAGSVAGIRGLYSLRLEDDPGHLERVWQDYESRLADAIDDLIDRKLDAITWAGVLVPFVAALMVRGRDFNERFEYRLRAFAGIWGPDNTNQARLFELQRLLGPVLAARWIVMATTGGSSLITNDVGFAFFRDPSGAHGLSVPLGHRHVLGLIPARGRAVVEAQDGVWRPLIEYTALHHENHHGLRIALSQGARRFIFGADEATISGCLRAVDSSPTSTMVPEPGALWPISGATAAAHEFTWHRLIGALAKSPDQAGPWSFEIDWPAVAASPWTPPVILPTNLPPFPSSLRREGDRVYVYLFDAFPDASGEWTLHLPADWADPPG